MASRSISLPLSSRQRWLPPLKFQARILTKMASHGSLLDFASHGFPTALPVPSMAFLSNCLSAFLSAFLVAFLSVFLVVFPLACLLAFILDFLSPPLASCCLLSLPPASSLFDAPFALALALGIQTRRIWQLHLDVCLGPTGELQASAQGVALAKDALLLAGGMLHANSNHITIFLVIFPRKCVQQLCSLHLISGAW